MLGTAEIVNYAIIFVISISASLIGAWYSHHLHTRKNKYNTKESRQQVEKRKKDVFNVPEINSKPTEQNSVNTINLLAAVVTIEKLMFLYCVPLLIVAFTLKSSFFATLAKWRSTLRWKGYIDIYVFDGAHCMVFHSHYARSTWNEQG